MSLPSTTFDNPSFLGAPLEGFACIQCGETPDRFVALAMKDELVGEKPVIVTAYALCPRCASLFWEESGERFLKCLQAMVKEIP